MIFLHGPDCSGKDSVRHELSKMMNYEPYIAVRSPICNIVYDNIHNRQNSSRYELNFILIDKLVKNFDSKFIYLKTNEFNLEKRAIIKGEKHIKNRYDALIQIHEYESILSHYERLYPDNFFSVCTDNKNVNEISVEILNVL